MSLSLARPTAGAGSDDSYGAFGVGMDVVSASAPGYKRAVQADVNVYSYQGRDTGKHGSPSGLPSPELVVSTGEALKAGTFVKAQGSGAGLVHGLGRMALYQPNLGGQARGGAPHVANIAILAAGKFATTSLSALADRWERGEDGVHIEGAQRFSGVGAGNANPGTLAGSVALIVVAQELATALFEALEPMIPGNWKRPSDPSVRKAVGVVTKGAEEFARLEINLGVQKILGLREGAAWDHATVAISSVLKAVVETTRDSIGARESHPYSHSFLDAANALQYLLLRVTGMTLSAEPGEAGRLTDFNEAARTRVNLRLYDQVLTSAFKPLLNGQGWIGENADPFDHQIARERAIKGFASKLKDALGAGAGHGDWEPMEALMGEDGNLVATIRASTEKALVGDHGGWGGRKPEDTEFFDEAGLQSERVKHLLNRVDLYAGSVRAFLSLFAAAFNTMRQAYLGMGAGAGRGATDSSRDVERAIALQTLDAAGREAGLAEIDSEQDARIRGAEAYAQNRSALEEGEALPTTNALEEASSGMQSFVRKQHRALEGKHAALPADGEGQPRLASEAASPLSARVAQPTQPDYSGRARSAGGHTATIGVSSSLRAEGPAAGLDTTRIRREQGTFSRQLQRGAVEEGHLAMTRASGLKDVVDTAAKLQKANPTAGTVSVARGSVPAAFDRKMKDRIEAALRDYTVESQFFHYPLRWQVTGQPMLLQVAPGVQIAYNILNKPGNVRGEKAERVDPIEALYVNVGCARASKLSGHLLRAVVTMAAYKNLAPGEAEPNGQLSANGSKAVLTEIFSASASAKVAAEFNLPISGYGAAARDRSQRLDLVQETAVNVSNLSDLAQAEAILTPGAMFTVKKIDANAGRPPAASAADPRPQDIGQVVYMAQVDTYQLEKDFDRCRDHLNGHSTTVRPEDNTLVADPDTGQFFRFVAEPQPGDKLYDPDSKTYYPHDAKSAQKNGGLKFASETKNYFLGRPLEYESNPPEQLALWRHPYTSETAKRATKDAVHAAIVRGGDPILKHLDEAVKNLHHEHFRTKGGFYEKRVNAQGVAEFVNPRARAEAEKVAEVKARAGAIAAAQTEAIRLNEIQNPEALEMLAWLAASYLRTPIKLIPVNGHTGLARKGMSFHETYDKVDLFKQALNQKPDPSVLIGVGDDGYYAIRHVDGNFEPTHKVERRAAGASPENFMQAYLLAGPLGKAHYRVAPDDPSVFVPDDFASRSGQQLLRKIVDFAATDYIVLQEALVARQRQAQERSPHDASDSSRAASSVAGSSESRELSEDEEVEAAVAAIEEAYQELDPMPSSSHAAN